MIYKHRVERAPPEKTLNSSHMSALERTLHDFRTRVNGEVIVPAVGVIVDSFGELTTSTICIPGNVVRYGRRLNFDRVKCMQEIVYLCSENQGS